VNSLIDDIAPKAYAPTTNTRNPNDSKRGMYEFLSLFCRSMI
jgi:hypothetical protein